MTTPNTQLALKEFVRKPEIMASFERLLNRDAESYVQSVLIAVSGSDELMKCTNQSIYRSALRAASLGLSCDPALKQAWLVPYSRNVGTRENPQWVKEAQFQPHYKGLYTLAMRTNKYQEIEVIPIGDGYKVQQSIESGIVIVHEATGQPAIAIPKVKPSEAKIWFAWFRTTRGFVKKIWMSVEEIHEHAKQFNPKGYDGKGSPWQKPEMRPFMEMKTVLRNLLSWADLSGTENAKLAEALQAEEHPIDVEAEDAPEEIKSEPVAMTIEAARNITVNIGGETKPIGVLAVDELNSVFLDDNSIDTTREAVRLVLSNDFNMDVPEKSKRSEAQLKGQMGF